MVAKERPHYLWIGAIGAVALALGGLAWWLWSGPKDPQEAGPDTAPSAGSTAGADPSTSPNPDSAGEPAGDRSAERAAARYQMAVDRVLEAAGLALESGDFAAARSALAKAPTEKPWPAALSDLSARIDSREAAFRSDLRPIEFRIQAIETNDDSGSYFARFSLEGTPVFSTPILTRSVDVSAEGRQANLVTLRTSFHLGATVEILSESGMFGGPKLLLGPLALSPLPNLDGGELTFGDPEGDVRRLAIEYRMSPFTAGLTVDSPVPDPPGGASAAGLLDAIGAALAKDQTATATRILDRLTVEHPGHPDLAFNERRINGQIESLARNRTRVEFVVMEIACDPRTGGSLWASDGSRAPFRCAIESGDETLARTSDGPCAPYLIPGATVEPPQGNLLKVRARGDLPLRLTVTDTSPTFGTRDVGFMDLGLTLADLPRGTGTLTLERDPMVLVLPENDDNRVRRVVLRWTVTR